MKTQGMRELPRDGAATGIAQKLRVMTYNVLAQCYVRSSFFPYCDSSELRWKNRSKKLEAVFASNLPVSPDVICLQEVDNYDKFWANMMKSHGYDGFFVKKTGTKPDGVAVFWKATKLKVKESQKVSLDLPNGDEYDVDHELLSRAQRGTVGAIVHFEHLETPLEFVVATTHLFWDPMQEDVKLLQSRRMLRAIEEFTSAVSTSTPTIFAGDFNSLPDSKVYNFITNKNDFRSAYSQYDPDDGEPKFTNVNGDADTDDGKKVPRFVGTLDYIFYRSPRMRPAALMEIMSLEDASKKVALPSAISPSDHLPLLCEFHIAN
ncbi:hypothetical protein PRIC1_014576 [Phytophthora ramorum]|uniref:Endonuclease/exonuclease/phosphatase domain-containing protein n=1 Tax=Phytophthora ramorum TaxID=164328 RepID=H3GZT5_PHYRM|nr:Carbon catabolite repressor protein 4-like protein 4 [Phytophthora ramorum]KAH7495043.1 Carbon catabolite repressor protein 4-like protein 4 [Phytophthora ramorum]